MARRAAEARAGHEAVARRAEAVARETAEAKVAELQTQLRELRDGNGRR